MLVENDAGEHCGHEQAQPVDGRDHARRSLLQRPPVAEPRGAGRHALDADLAENRGEAREDGRTHCPRQPRSTCPSPRSHATPFARPRSERREGRARRRRLLPPLKRCRSVRSRNVVPLTKSLLTHSHGAEVLTELRSLRARRTWACNDSNSVNNLTCRARVSLDFVSAPRAPARVSRAFVSARRNRAAGGA